VIVGGPPCQGFSPLGRDRDDVSRASLNELWQHYLRAVRQVQPLAFVIENVPKFQRSAQFAKLLQLMETDRFLKKYKFAYGVLNAADYGVPRSRRRGIFVAVQGRGRGALATTADPRPELGRRSSLRHRSEGVLDTLAV
jgi:DNA (cytosine-5)-methyltransferase 1